MSDSRREVELLLKAKTEGLKTIQDAVTNIEKLSKVIDQQVAASKRGEGSIKELEKAYGELEKINKLLANHAAAVRVFDDTVQKLDAVSPRLDTARTRYEAISKAIGAAGVATKEQNKELNAATKELSSAQNAYDKVATSVANQSTKLEALGVDLESVDNSWKQLLATMQKADAVSRSATSGFGAIGSNQAAFKAEQERLRELEQYEDQRRARELADEEAFLREKAAAKQKWEASERANTQKMYEGLFAERLQQEERLARASSTIRQPAALKQVTDQAVAAGRGFRTLGGAADDAGGKLFAFARGERTTLSYLQRMRGEILALTTAYIGFNGAIQLANSSADAFASKQGIKNQLGLSVGNDPKAIAAEYDYIRAQADRLGIAFEGAAKGYAKFSAAAAMSGRNQQEIRYVFESFAEVGRVANLTTDDMNGVFKALEQIYSKGKIQAEELRGQIGDRLFGAFQIAAKALKDQFPDLDKAMKDGMVTSEQLLAIAEQYRKTVSEQLPGAMASLSASQERLNSAVFDFKVAIAEGGFADAYSKLLTELSVFFQSDDGKKFAQSISDGFTAVVNVLRWMLENRNDVLGFLKTAAILWGSVKALQIAQDLALATKAVITFGSAVVAMGTKVEFVMATLTRFAGIPMIIQKAFAGLAAFFVGWEIGTYLRENFETVEKAGIAMSAGIHKAFVQLWSWLQQFGLLMQAGFAKWFSGDIIADFLRKIADAMREIPKIGGAIADGLNEAAKAISPTGDAGSKYLDQLAALREQTAKELNAIDDQYADMFASAGGRNPAAAGAPRVGGSTSTPKPSGGTGKPAAAPFAMDADAYTKERIAAELENIKNMYDEARLSAEEYYRRRAELQTQQIDAEIALHRKAIAELSTDKAEDRKKAGQELAQIAALEDKKAQIIRDAQHDRVKDEEGVRKQLAEIQSKILGDEGQTVEARKAKLLVEYHDLLERLKAEGDAAGIELVNKLINVDAAKGRMDELQTEIDHILAQGKERADNIRADNKIGSGNPLLDAMLNGKQVRAANAGTIGELTTKRDELQGFAKNGIDGAQEKVDKLNKSIRALESDGKSAFQVLGESALKAFGEGVGKLFDSIIEGSMSAKDALNEFAISFVKSVAQMIVKAMAMYAVIVLLNAIPGGSAVAQSLGFAAQKNHMGGVVTGAGMGHAANPAWFTNAPRYHTGGIVGLQPDEVPSILKKNEEVLSTNDPRNRLNGGGATARPQDIKVVNAIDSASVLKSALDSPEGQKTIMNFMRANQASVRQQLGG